MAVPVTRIPFVAFFAMQVGVNPGGGRRIDVLNNFVSLIPLALLFMPECGQVGRKLGGWMSLRQARFKRFKVHISLNRKRQDEQDWRKKLSSLPIERILSVGLPGRFK